MGFAEGVLQIGQGSEWLSILFVACVKSIVILAAAALVTHILRSASARLRHVLWCAALSSLLVLPLFSGGLQPLRVPILPSALFPNGPATQQPSHDAGLELLGQTATALPADAASQTRRQNGRSNLPLVDERRPRSVFSWQSIILPVWLIGVLLVLGRFLVGVFNVRRLIHRADELTGTSWSELLSELSRELRLKRPVRLLRSDEGVMPMTCGGPAVVVLLPNEADRWPDDRKRAVVLHELAHIKRRDVLTQTVAQVVCALYWFNPLVWWAVRKLRIEQEWACDEQVVAAGIRREEYAAHLLEIARKFRADRTSALTTTAMARPSQLQERLYAILKPQCESGRNKAVSVVVMSVVFISTAVTQLVTAEKQSGINALNLTDDVTQIEQKEKAAFLGEQKRVVTNPSAPPDPEDNFAPGQTPSPTPIDQPAGHPAVQPLDPPDDLATTSQDTAHGSNQTAEQIFNGFSVEERNRLLNNGIRPAYIKEMAGAGYRGLSVAQLIALFSNAVRADYVAGLRSLGYGGLSTADLLSLKTNGITPDLIRSFRAVKHADFRATNYVALRSNGVTPSYLKSLSAAGYDGLTAKQILEMRLAGVTAEFIRDARSRGETNLSPEELVQLKRREKQ